MPANICWQAERRFIMESKYKSFDELPLMLSVVQVAEVLGISKTSAYELSHTKSFPSMTVGGRIIVPRDKFIEWINLQTEK